MGWDMRIRLLLQDDLATTTEGFFNGRKGAAELREHTGFHIVLHHTAATETATATATGITLGNTGYGGTVRIRFAFGGKLFLFGGGGQGRITYPEL